jgi:hypothetical protein
MSKIYNRTDAGKDALLSVALDDQWLRHCLRLVDGKRDVPTLLKMLPAGAGEALIDKLERLGYVTSNELGGAKLARTMPPALRTSGLKPIELTSNVNGLPAPTAQMPAAAPAPVAQPATQAAARPLSHTQPSETVKRLSNTTTQMQILIETANGIKAPAASKTGAPIEFKDSTVDLFKVAGIDPKDANADAALQRAFEKTAPMATLQALATEKPQDAVPQFKPSIAMPAASAAELAKTEPAKKQAVGESTMMIRALNADPFQSVKLRVISGALNAMSAAELGDMDELQQLLARAVNADELSKAARTVYIALKETNIFEAGNFDDLVRKQLSSLR